MEKASIALDARGERVVDDSFYLLFNAHYEPLTFVFPQGKWGDEWIVILDTTQLLPEEKERLYKAGDKLSVESRSLKVLRRVH